MNVPNDLSRIKTKLAFNLRFSWPDIVKTGMGTKDFIAPDSFDFTASRTFRLGQSWGAASYLQIMASELSDKLLLELLELDAEMTVTLHVQTVDQLKAIKMTKGKISGIAQKYNCALKRLDWQQEQGFTSSLVLGDSAIEIQRGMTTSSTAIFIPFMTKELRMDGAALYYGMNALSNNIIMADRKRLKNPKGRSGCGHPDPYRNRHLGQRYQQPGDHPSAAGC